MNENKGPTTREWLEAQSENRTFDKKRREQQRAETVTKRQSTALEAFNNGIKKLKEMADKAVEKAVAAPEALADTFDNIKDSIDNQLTALRADVADKRDATAASFVKKSEDLLGRFENWRQTRKSEAAQKRAEDAKEKAQRAKEKAEKEANAAKAKAEAEKAKAEAEAAKIRAEAEARIAKLEGRSSANIADIEARAKAATDRLTAEAKNQDEAAEKAELASQELKDDAASRLKNAQSFRNLRAGIARFLQS